MGEGRKGAKLYTVEGTPGVYWSYSTCIAVVDSVWEMVVVNTTKYSATTGPVQWMLQRELAAQFPAYRLVLIDGCGFNVQPGDLLDAAHGQVDAAMIGDSPESILGYDDESMRRVWVNPWSGRVHVKNNRSTLI
jgi:hypothetical protein